MWDKREGHRTIDWWLNCEGLFYNWTRRTLGSLINWIEIVNETNGRETLSWGWNQIAFHRLFYWIFIYQLKQVIPQSDPDSKSESESESESGETIPLCWEWGRRGKKLSANIAGECEYIHSCDYDYHLWWWPGRVEGVNRIKDGDICLCTSILGWWHFPRTLLPALGKWEGGKTICCNLTFLLLLPIYSEFTFLYSLQRPDCLPCFIHCSLPIIFHFRWVNSILMTTPPAMANARFPLLCLRLD